MPGSWLSLLAVLESVSSLPLLSSSSWQHSCCNGVAVCYRNHWNVHVRPRIILGSGYIPPDFTVEDDGDKDNDGTDAEYFRAQDSSTSKGRKKLPREIPEYSFDDGSPPRDRTSDFQRGGNTKKRKPFQNSWPEKRTTRNSDFSGDRGPSGLFRNKNFDRSDGESRRFPSNRPPLQDRTTKTFRQDFRGCRVFVQGIPLDASWQDLKDHFRIAGAVVFASISQDLVTGDSKGHGIVQFETTEMATKAISIMKDHPMDGQVLMVREDVQEGDSAAFLKNNQGRTNTRPTTNLVWRCADEENATTLSESDRTEILSLIQTRNDARRQKNFQLSDEIREELKVKFGVHMDDRLKMWWTSMDGKNVPLPVQDVKGHGRWGLRKLEPWRQIPTTPENDACVNPLLVEGLLNQRDIARQEKDFKTADTLLQQARNAPENNLILRIHDESRTWRVWTEEPPPSPNKLQFNMDDKNAVGPAEQCMAIIQKYEPEKVEEIQSLLKNFPGREYNILKKLKQRYLKE